MTDVERPSFEVADIIREYGDEYRNKHKLTPLYQGALNAICNCRTAILGGHIEECDTCGDQRNCYNSCRNRHCPKCQGLDNVRWGQEREAELLPIQYFHVIFTLPHELNLLAQYTQAILYNILIQSATETLQSFADKRWKGTLGITVVLHTWGQTLEQLFICIPLSLVAYLRMINNAGLMPPKTTCSKSKTSAPSIAKNSATNSNKPLHGVN